MNNEEEHVICVSAHVKERVGGREGERASEPRSATKGSPPAC